MRTDRSVENTGGRILIVHNGRILAMAEPDAPCDAFAYPHDARVCRERMAAAAPLLYEACRSALERIDGMNEAMGVIDELRRAIASAEGRAV